MIISVQIVDRKTLEYIFLITFITTLDQMVADILVLRFTKYNKNIFVNFHSGKTPAKLGSCRFRK